MTFKLRLVDSQQTIPLGEFTVDNMEQAIKDCKKKYKGMFKRLTLSGWKVLADFVR